MTVWTTVTMQDDDGSDIEVEVSYRFIPGYPGSRIDPPESDEVEVLTAKVKGKPVPDRIWKWLTGDLGQEYLCQDYRDGVEYAACEAADARREAWA
jgi:hypothetical protein